MSQIIIEDLIKRFRVSERDAGMWGAIRGIVKRRYHTIDALDGVSFSIESGELVGYIGPNGAGKSTTVKVMSGILVPDAGRCEILGRVPWRNRTEHVSRIGVVFGQRTQLWWDLPVIESFDLLRDIYRIPRAEYATNRDEFIAVLNIEGCLDVPVRQLSLGQRMRCDLAAALLHSPDILFLDEPTIGMDAVSKLAFREFIKQFNQERGTTVILTTHDMDDIEVICDRVMIINDGKIVSDGTLDELRRRVSLERRLVVELVDNVIEPTIHPLANLANRDGRRIHIQFDPHQISAADLIAHATSQNQVQDLFVENPPIEETIARIYKDQAT
ncbi:MAG: ATP-binding cassette domain-containing protein [Chloroflexi bacterium]|nr:ATP-binding cassette domain-containing protein [Chloroflexota bacterium]MYK61987.1 ATP-binding cassette domain-containing protein [Chloroflexota bacterium]